MLPAVLFASALAVALPGQNPPPNAQWLWGHWTAGAAAENRPAEEHCYLRKHLQLAAAPAEASVRVTADNHFRLYANGRLAGEGHDWGNAGEIDLAPFLHAGLNVLAVDVWNDGGPAGVLLFGGVELVDGRRVPLASDASWLSARQSGGGDAWTHLRFPAADWKPAQALGAFGTGPWTAVTFAARQDFEVPPGFVVREVASGFGSLVALGLDADGNPLASVEGSGVRRLEDRDGDGRFETVTTLTDELKNVQGLCVAYGTIWLVGHGPEGQGLYALQDDGSVVLHGLITPGGGEHSAHAVVPGPDGRLYVTLGNHCYFDQASSPASPFRIHYEGHLLPRMLDPRGHANHVVAPGGTVHAYDPRPGVPAELRWESFAGGFRNTYDIAFDAHGSLFAYDSDMEWDI
ncbi:MAG TPA: hypothetical protein VGC54_08930, partial [Planctomycetota bacterium]